MWRLAVCKREGFLSVNHGGLLLTNLRKDSMAKKQTNKATIAENFDANEREQIVFHRDYDPKPYQQGCGIVRFKNVPLSDIKTLVEKGYLNPDEEMDRGARAQDFINFVEEHGPEYWTFHGYVVSPDRFDKRVTIEGIKSQGYLIKDDLIDFLFEFRMADELDFEDGIAYCWYD